MPLFSDVYNALLKKGVEFPGSESTEIPQNEGSPVKAKKNVQDLPPKYQKIV